VASMVVLLCVASCTSASEGQARAERETIEKKPPLSQQSNSQSVPETPSVSEEAINGGPVNKEAAQSPEQDVKEKREEKEVKKERYIVAYVPDYPSA